MLLVSQLSMHFVRTTVTTLCTLLVLFCSTPNTKHMNTSVLHGQRMRREFGGTAILYFVRSSIGCKFLPQWPNPQSELPICRWYFSNRWATKPHLLIWRRILRNHTVNMQHWASWNNLGSWIADRNFSRYVMFTLRRTTLDTFKCFKNP